MTANQLQLLALLSKHSRLRGMILELRNKNLKVRHDTLDRSLLVQAQLAKWVNDVHDATEPSAAYADEALDESATEDADDLCSVYHKTLLNVLQYARKALHILKQLSRRGTKWPDSCVNAVEHIIVALEKEGESSGKSSEDSRSPMDARTGVQHVHNPNSGNFHERTRSPYTSNTTAGTLGLNDRTSNPSNNDGQIDQTPLFDTSRHHYTSDGNRETQTQFQETPMSQTAYISNSTNQADLEMTRISLGMPDIQEQWLDPLNALDFSNFAQAGTSDSAIGFGFY
ncbi:hypothetical protein MGN70_011739 [Eutypa lata]|nr:hypothetical protein MGN70_011739 [Eutypa lata]